MPAGQRWLSVAKTNGTQSDRCDLPRSKSISPPLIRRKRPRSDCVSSSSPLIPFRSTLNSPHESGGMGSGVWWCGPRTIRPGSKEQADVHRSRQFRMLQEGCTKVAANGAAGSAGLLPFETVRWLGFATAGRTGGGKGAGRGKRLQFGSTHPATISRMGSESGMRFWLAGRTLNAKCGTNRDHETEKKPDSNPGTGRIR